MAEAVAEAKASVLPWLHKSCDANMSKVQQGFECPGASSANSASQSAGARDENMKPLLGPHFHIKSKPIAWPWPKGAARHGKAWPGSVQCGFIMHAANVVIAATGHMQTGRAKQIRNPSEFLTPARRYDK